jgi:hypothetical protein
MSCILNSYRNPNHRKVSRTLFGCYTGNTGIIDTSTWKHEVRPYVSFLPWFLWNSLVPRNFKGNSVSYSFVPNGTIGICPIGILSSKIPTFFLCSKWGLKMDKKIDGSSFTKRWYSYWIQRNQPALLRGRRPRCRRHALHQLRTPAQLPTTSM